jgi:2'-5' RNA ligase
LNDNRKEAKMTDPDARLFVAVPLSSDMKQTLISWSNELKKHFPFRKWVDRDDLHITLQFLGNTPHERIANIEIAIREALALAAPFELVIMALGTFGRPANPSILWAGIGGQTDQLHNLQQLISGRLATIGYKPEERPFHPHLTLARNYNAEEPFDRELLDKFVIPSTPSGDPLHWKTDEIVLYTSHIGRRPSMYEAISRFPLQEACSSYDTIVLGES